MGELELADARRIVREAWAAGIRPDPKLTVSQWADLHRILSSKSSSSRGPWRTDRTPYLREIMDALTPGSPYERIVLQKGTQIGATECGNNWVGHTIDVAPGPMLMVLPTVDIARRVSKQRITPMINVSPRLTSRVKSARSRDSGNTTFAKDFEGGILLMTGANSAAGLSSMPIKNLFLDEPDRYPAEVGTEGDPVSLAEARTSTFPDRKIFMCSSPTVRNVSRIEKAYLQTDQRRYVVPCPYCGTLDWIQWSAGGWYGKEGRHHYIVFENRDPFTARLKCSGCSELIEEHHKTKMLAEGMWEPTAVSQEPRTIGFHLSALYSPLGWESWPELVAMFLASKEDTYQLKTFVNTRLGETWEETGSNVEPESVMGRAEAYGGEVPTGVGILIAGVDVQADRIECVVKGYGAGEESWLIAHQQFYGEKRDTGQPDAWYELDRFLKNTFAHESGQTMKIECVGVDTNFETNQAYQFCYARRARRVFAVRGGSAHGTEIVSKPTFGNRYRLPLFTVSPDTCKEVIYARLRIKDKGPGYMHFPSWVDPEYAAQLTAETAIRKYVKGKGSIRTWVKKRERNEALDCEVYALAALHILGQTLIKGLKARADRFAAAAATPAGDAGDAPEVAGALEEAARPPAPRPRPRGGWVNNWKK
jgi:phage terminase large subunit GpA-like protein